ncbi:hypothetical protein ABR862_004892 [Pseudomonas aeruginosa]
MSTQNNPNTIERARAQIRKVTKAADAYEVNFWLTRTIGYLEALEAEKLIDGETARLLGAELDRAREEATACSVSPNH